MIFSDLVIIWSMSISRDLSDHHSFSLFSSSFSFFSSFSSLSTFSSFSSFTETRLSLLRLLWYSSIGTKQPSSQSNIVPFGLKFAKLQSWDIENQKLHSWSQANVQESDMWSLCNNLNWTCGILSMGAAGPRGKRRTFASWLWGTPPPWLCWWTPPPPWWTPPPQLWCPPYPADSSAPPTTDLLPLSWPGAVLPSMVEMGVRWSWSGEREETSMGLWTTVHGIEFTLEPKWVSCSLGILTHMTRHQ